MHELIRRIEDDLGLTRTERDQLLPGGSTTVIASRVHWAKTYLKQAGLVAQPKRGQVEATAEGRKLLAAHPVKIDRRLLDQFPPFRAFISKSAPALPQGSPAAEKAAVALASATPEEQIAAATALISGSLGDALLARLLESSPTFFERTIIDLLLAMGYGGSAADASQHLGGTNDGGVDGLIREDQLGLDRIYLQAKRYQPGSTVSSEAVRAFVGALVGKGAQKGVFITTSSFSKDAMLAAQHSGALRIVLVDGGTLTDLMIRFNVGVRVKRTIELKDVDTDYFSEERAE